MKNKYFLLSALFIALFCSFVFTNNCHALNSYSGQIKLIKHFKTGNKCGVGTDCLYDDGSGEMQSFALTPRHIVLSYLIDSGSAKDYKETTRSRIYFIDRKTFKIAKILPDKKNFTCNKYGNPGCYNHPGSLAYNSKTGKLLLATQAGTFVFDDVTMQYESRMTGLHNTKISYNQVRNWYWTGFEGNTIKDVKMSTIQKTSVSKYPNAKYEENPSTWKDYLVVNNYMGGKDAILRFYNYKNSKLVKDIGISQKAIKTDVVKSVQFDSDGTAFLMTPLNNEGNARGRGAAIYAISGKDLGISESTNTDPNSKPTSGNNAGSSDNCGSGDESCDCGVESTKRAAGAKSNEPEIEFGVTRDVKCTSILPDSLCNPNGGGQQIADILDLSINTMTFGVGIIGSFAIVICGFMVMSAGGSSSQVEAAKKRFYGVVIGLITWCVFSMALNLFIVTESSKPSQVSTSSGGSSSNTSSGGKASSGSTGSGGSSGSASKQGKTAAQTEILPTCIKLTVDSIVVAVGKTKTIGYTIYPANATNKDVIWSSKNSKIATVNKKGVVTGVSAGTTTVEAKTKNGKTATVSVTVGSQTSTPEKSYGVFLGLDYEDGEKVLSKMYKYKLVVIDFQEHYPKSYIDKLHAKGIKVYSYLNIGSVEMHGRYYSNRFNDYYLDHYENWKDEMWVDVSKTKFQTFITDELEPSIRKKGVDGYFIDNTDVYANYKKDKIYKGLQTMLRKIHSYGLPVLINGGDEFVSRAISDGSYTSLFDGVNQEEVFTLINFDNKTYHKQKSDETKYYKNYLQTVKKAGLMVYLLEYGSDPNLEKQMKSYCNLNGFSYYYAKTLKLE